MTTTLQYTHAAPGNPLISVCGLSLVKRAAITLSRAGTTRLVVVAHAADAAAIRAELADKRITAAVELADAPEGSVLSGDRVFLKSALESETSANWRPVAGPQDIPAAEDMLIASLTKAADGIVARNINRKISTRISRRLAPYAVHPNQVSAIVCLIGVLSYPLNAMGSWLGFALGGLCYYASSVLDGVDGELSRLKFLGSPLGAWVDTIVDDIVGTAYLAGLYLGLHRQMGGELWKWVGIVAIVGYFLTILPRYWLMITRVGVGDHQAIQAKRSAGEKRGISRWVDFLATKVFRLDFLMFMAFLLSLASLPWIYAGFFALGSVLSVGETIYTVSQLRRR